MRRVWNWLAIARVLSLTDRIVSSSRDVDRIIENFTEPPIALAQAVRFAMLPYGMRLPDTDEGLLAAARQYGAPAATESPRLAGSLLVHEDGRLSFALDQVRTIEAAALALTIVTEPAPGRYVAAWEIPGVVYLGGI